MFKFKKSIIFDFEGSYATEALITKFCIPVIHKSEVFFIIPPPKSNILLHAKPVFGFYFILTYGIYLF